MTSIKDSIKGPEEKENKYGRFLLVERDMSEIDTGSMRKYIRWQRYNALN